MPLYYLKHWVSVNEWRDFIVIVRLKSVISFCGIFGWWCAMGFFNVQNVPWLRKGGKTLSYIELDPEKNIGTGGFSWSHFLWIIPNIRSQAFTVASYIPAGLIKDSQSRSPEIRAGDKSLYAYNCRSLTLRWETGLYALWMGRGSNLCTRGLIATWTGPLQEPCTLPVTALWDTGEQNLMYSPNSLGSSGFFRVLSDVVSLSLEESELLILE